jgi:molybdopterin molybdotransferase
MISVEAALETVLSKPGNYGVEKVRLDKIVNRFLADDIFADRDSPPYDRVMMDGIAIRSSELDAGKKLGFFIEGIQAAGDVQKKLQEPHNCIEVMTGTLVPEGTDTIVPYEQVDIIDNRAFLKQPFTPKKHIHLQGSDHKKGTLALQKGKRLAAADAGLLAAVGIENVPVFTLPKTAIVATGNELIPVAQVPESHQVRMSNVYALQAALQTDCIAADIFHINDDEAILFTQLFRIVKEYDVVLISGGVSKGKYDFVPAILDKLGVQKLFHQVAQRPGKPFWFGHQPALQTLVFAFPGNPVSTFVCYQFYFRQWLAHSFTNQQKLPLVQLAGEITGSEALSLFIPVKAGRNDNTVSEIVNNGSGDLFSLAVTDGFIYLPKGAISYPSKSVFSFLPIN